MGAMDCGSGAPQPRDGLYDYAAGAESLILIPGLICSLEPGNPIELCSQPIDVDEAHSASDSLRIDHKNQQEIWLT